MFETDQTVKDVRGSQKIKLDGQPIKVNVSQPTSKHNTLVAAKKGKTSDNDDYEND